MTERKRISIEDTPFKGYTEKDWVLYFIAEYGMDDGAHHKHWLLDQIARIHTGAEIIVTKVVRGETERYDVDVSLADTEKYLAWTKEHNFTDDI